MKYWQAEQVVKEKYVREASRLFNRCFEAIHTQKKTTTKTVKINSTEQSKLVGNLREIQFALSQIITFSQNIHLQK